MVKCRRFDRLLMGYFDHDLTPLEQALLDRHLEGCPRCRAARGDLSGILGVLETHTPVEVPHGLAAAVLDRIASLPPVTEKERKGSERVLHRLFLGIGAALFLGLYAVVQDMSYFDLLEAATGVVESLWSYFVDLQIAYRIVSIPFSAELGYLRWQLQVASIFTLSIFILKGVGAALVRQRVRDRDGQAGFGTG